MAVLKTEALTYQYSIGTPFEKTAVDHVSLEIEEGAFVGIIGHTGSGKSTLIQHFNGLIRPTSGKIYLDGKDIWEDKTNIRQVRFQVGLVFQYPEYQVLKILSIRISHLDQKIWACLNRKSRSGWRKPLPWWV